MSEGSEIYGVVDEDSDLLDIKCNVTSSHGSGIEGVLSQDEAVDLGIYNVRVPKEDKIVGLNNDEVKALGNVGYEGPMSINGRTYMFSGNQKKIMVYNGDHFIETDNVFGDEPFASFKEIKLYDGTPPLAREDGVYINPADSVAGFSFPLGGEEDSNVDEDF